MSYFNYECRFCLKKMLQNEKMALIDDEIKLQFVNLTQIELELTENLSQIICELCLRSLQLAYTVKTQFIESQKKLCFTNNIQIESISSGYLAGTNSQAERVKQTRKIKVNTETNHNYKDTFLECQNPDNGLTFTDSVLNIKEEIQDETDQCSQQESQPCSLLDQMDIKPQLSQLSLQYMQLQKVVSPKKSYKCCYCENSYRRRDHMSRHIQEEHKGIKFRCVVPGCPAIYRRKEKVRTHITSRHTELNETDLACMVEQVKTLVPFYDIET